MIAKSMVVEISTSFPWRASKKGQNMYNHVTERLQKFRQFQEQRAAERQQDGYVYRVIEVGVAICDFKSSVRDVVIPETLDGLPVLRVEVPDNTDELSDSAVRMLLPASVVSVAGEIVGMRRSFREYKVAESNPHLCSRDGVLFTKDGRELVLYPQAKGGCYTVPDGVMRIRQGAFACCGGLNEVVIPDSVKDIDDVAFHMCLNLERVRLPSGLTRVAHGLFDSCDSLREIRIPDTIEVIDACAFCSCERLREVVIPARVMRIESNAFRGCTGLERVIFEGPCPHIAADAFAGAEQAIVVRT